MCACILFFYFFVVYSNEADVLPGLSRMDWDLVRGGDQSAGLTDE